MLLVVSLLIGLMLPARAQQSVARQWNEVLLESIRNDFARPTVHARNLFHVSAAMYDAWAVFSEEASTYLLGREVHGFTSPFIGFDPSGRSLEALQEEAISYAAYRLLDHRFANSPGREETMAYARQLLEDELGYDASYVSADYTTGSAAALGNYIADQYIAYGLVDGSNELAGYANQYYEPVNIFLNTSRVGNPHITDPNRWQPLAFDIFIDQSGHVIPNAIPDFLGPEWGWVAPFSLLESEMELKARDGFYFPVYHDPGPPPYLDTLTGGGLSDAYKWNFSLVAIWSGHLDANLDKVIDISPASLGNFDIDDLPTDPRHYDQFYQYLAGGDSSTGRPLNPVTGTPYTPQPVKLGDYARILAEFWADGPDSETPPGHWFTIMNYVNDHPLLVRKLAGTGPEIDPLEWDIKAYFMLGGAMHDVAISVWGIKGYYDYIRPVSAIRYMADRGQSSDPDLPNYHVAGIPLVEGHIELVMEDDPLVGPNQENLYKIKLWAWRGPSYIDDPETDVAGVGWILAEWWWPYQRPSFITPPFAGYVSGHSTFSRAAAELLTRLTGDPFFPGGMGIFDAPTNEFLVFEDGPTEDIELQWATYRDASDQCSLSRIWGGIHPPADDLPGRRIGVTIGNEAFEYALTYFTGKTATDLLTRLPKDYQVYPNPAGDWLHVAGAPRQSFVVELFDLSGHLLQRQTDVYESVDLDLRNLPVGDYLLVVGEGSNRQSQLVVKQ